jgi:16S rRNA (cytosine967-C5)-methyltransferase
MKPGKESKISAARRVALDVLRKVEAEGAFTQLSLNHTLRRAPHLTPQDRALTTELVYGTLRWRRRLDFALNAYCSRPLEKIEPLLLRILRLSAYQLLFLDRVPRWAVVDQATEMATVIRGRRSAGFVNAVLRALASAPEQIEWPDPAADPVHALAILHSMQDWMVEYWLKQLGETRAVALMEAVNRPAPLWIRTNTLRTTPEALLELLATSALEAEVDRVVPGAIKLRGAGDVTQLASHETGLFHIQDAAAQAVCHLLDPHPGDRVLDACGAPGGKTATMAELMQDTGEILSVDIHPARVALVRQLQDRLGIQCVKTQALDLGEVPPGELGAFDRILLDAPCSAIGVIRRHPDTKWKLTPEDLPRFAQIQQDLLNRVSQLLKPGGVLVYSVCTFSEEEGHGLITRWLADHPQFALVDPRSGKRHPWQKLLCAEGTLSTWPDLHDMDAFYAVRLQRKA